MWKTIKEIIAWLGCLAVWAVMLGLAYEYCRSARLETEAKAQRALEEAQQAKALREANQWRYDQELIDYQMRLQKRENDRILEEQEWMLRRLQPLQTHPYR